MNAHKDWMRPEGPVVNSPGREAGVTDMARLSAEGAALEVPIVPRLRRSISLASLSRPDGRAYSLPALRA